VAGIELDYRSRNARRTLAQLEHAPGEGDIRIALAHRPDAVRRLSPHTRVDLTVAGHTHGGQVQLPVVGPLTIASRVPREVGAGGLHELDGRSIYVSRGVGAERAQAPRLRLGAVPEVSLITLL
jgi:predicted MPP superfamily phosphohydrolase